MKNLSFVTPSPLQGRRGARVLRLADQEEWKTLISQSDSHDFYHTWSYHHLQQEHGEPLLFVYQQNTVYVAIPFIKRVIMGSGYYDLTSAYGYCGPIASIPFGALHVQFVMQFKSAFLEFLEEEKIVSVFAGLNPFIDQLPFLEVIGGVQDNGVTVAIDLQLSLEEQRSRYGKKVRGQIRRVKDLGWTASYACTAADVDAFLEIYNENMNRVDAADNYRFTSEYITALLASTDFDAHLMLVRNEQQYPVCGAIAISNGHVLQAHILGTREEYRHLSPAKYSTEEYTILARNLGLKYFNLGGGLGFRKDSLFEWKIRLSPLTFNYKTWRYVADPVRYDQLIDHYGIDRNAHLDYFPLYRAAAALHQNIS